MRLSSTTSTGGLTCHGHVVQEDEKAAVAADSKVASRFAYNQLVTEGEAAGSKGPGAKRGKDGHVQLSPGDDFFSAPLSTSGRKASGRCIWGCSPRCGRHMPLMQSLWR